MKIKTTMRLTKTLEQLKGLAAQRKCSVAELVNTAFSETISTLLKTAAQQ